MVKSGTRPSLTSLPYRHVIIKGCDLTTVPMEANVFHYGPGARLGLPEDTLPPHGYNADDPEIKTAET